MITKVKISAVVITYNEERKIEDCIKSLLSVADEIIVVDSFSTDSTEEICRRYPVKFVQHVFEGYVAQKNFAMTQASFDHILSLDADERLSTELVQSILEVKENWGAYHGYSCHRFNNYCGKWIRFSGWYPDKKIRLWNKNKGRWSGNDPHDLVIIPRKHVKRLRGDILHYAYYTVDEHIRQIYKFSDVAARAKFESGIRPIFVIHVILNPLYKFFRKYFLQLGFLDGYYGFVFCAVSASFNFFKYLKLYEYTKRGMP